MLYLDGNRLHTVAPDAFVNLRTLRSLKLSHNDLEGELDSRTLQSLSQLYTLGLDHNRLSGVRGGTFKVCKQLQDLAMESNSLSEVPAEAISALPLLRNLNLKDNRINMVGNGTFAGLRHLFALSLAGNRISEVGESAFEGVPDLQSLNLARNRIGKFGAKTFTSLKKLRHLRLDGNELTDINGLLTAQSELGWLNISENRLEWFDYAIVPRSIQG